MAEKSAWRGHQLNLLPEGESWLTGAPRVDVESTAPKDGWPFDAFSDDEPAPARQPVRPTTTTTSWRSTALLALLGLAALITIVVVNSSGKAKDPAPLPEAPGHVITALSKGPGTKLGLHVGEYVRLALPAAGTYSTVVEQSHSDDSVITDLKLPGQQPQLRADTTGHAIVEVMSEPVCADPENCSGARTLVGMLDVTVTP
jgi:hypothetical protein